METTRVREERLRSRMMALITGYYACQAIHCVAALEIADRLAEGPKNAEELAHITGCLAQPLERIMRALCTMEVFREQNGLFHLTPLSKVLQQRSENSLRPFALFQGNEMYKAFGCLLDNVKRGRAAWDAAHGMTIWQYLDSHGDRGALFDEMMSSLYCEETRLLLECYDFSAFRVIVDIGGGNGSMLTAILRAYKDVEGVLLEMPHVIDRVRASNRLREFGSRCQMVSGDLFSDVPVGGDLYIFRHVLHDWDDASCVRILDTCRKAMGGNARVIILEGPGSESSRRWLDLGMLIHGGSERSAEEYCALLTQTGFVCARKIGTVGTATLVEASRPPANANAIQHA